MLGMDGILRQAREMQSKMQTIQEDLAKKTVEGSSGGGMVRVVCTGKQEIVSVSIEKEAVDPADVEMLQDLVTSAVNDALRLSRSLAEQELSALTGGLKLPGLL